VETGYLLSGLLLGLSAGLAPGPLLTLVVSETMRHGSRAGARVALAPLVTDLPIIVLTLLAVERLSDFQPILAAISCLGGLVVLFLAYQNLRTRAGIQIQAALLIPAPGSLRKGVAVNLLSPHPWLFWFSVGAPLLVRAAAESLVAAAGFVAIFYLLLVGGKLVLARALGRWRSLLSGRAYLWIMRCLGLLLLFFALLLFRDGYALLRN
jgi:threonine/homoserine/homoserine lactone efflux protein